MCSKTCFEIHKRLSPFSSECSLCEKAIFPLEGDPVAFRKRAVRSEEFKTQSEQDKRIEIAALLSSKCNCAKGDCLLFFGEKRQEVSIFISRSLMLYSLI